MAVDVNKGVHSPDAHGRDAVILGVGVSAHSSSDLTRKVVRILSALAQRGERGVRPVDIARVTGIPRPTVYRILRELMDSDFVAKAESGTYALGPAVFELALSAPTPILDISRLRDVAQSLANRCGDTVYVAVRQFDGVNYIIRAEGSYPLQTHVPVGTSRGLANSFTGIALLSSVDAERRELAIARRVAGLADDEASALRAQLDDLIGQVRTRGYCAVPEIVLAGVSGVATPIRTGGGSPYAAVSISAASARMPPERIELLGRLLLATEREMRPCFAAGGRP
ncbi:IclR family transcriptional regulator C-terminal domain-containing protein [Thermopolyspora sp. NPDC052614]|uniref:IclR family transcriptional regulator n=1 Tax=Thermopolyspora sp. NPDC052614 TaxID=3155682 RepID=UPI0034134F79